MNTEATVRGVQASLDGKVEGIECELLLDCSGQAADPRAALFATRMYERTASPPTLAARDIMGRREKRERSYQHQDTYSVPIGSRFHPERAPLWEVGSRVESTEKWMGDR